MKKQTFLLPQPIIISPTAITIIVPFTLIHQSSTITYYSDCVFKPYVHKFLPNEYSIQQDKISIYFSFVLAAIENNPKILDNIGVLKIGQNIRYGILITKEKEGLFISLID